MKIKASVGVGIAVCYREGTIIIPDSGLEGVNEEENSSISYFSYFSNLYVYTISFYFFRISNG